MKEKAKQRVAIAAAAALYQTSFAAADDQQTTIISCCCCCCDIHQFTTNSNCCAPFFFGQKMRCVSKIWCKKISKSFQQRMPKRIRKEAENLFKISSKSTCACACLPAFFLPTLFFSLALTVELQRRRRACFHSRSRSLSPCCQAIKATGATVGQPASLCQCILLVICRLLLTFSRSHSRLLLVSLRLTHSLTPIITVTCWTFQLCLDYPNPTTHPPINNFPTRCVSVSRFTSARPASRSATPAGSCTAWSTASPQSKSSL